MGPRPPVAVSSGRGRIAPRASEALTMAPHRGPRTAPRVQRVIVHRAPKAIVARAPRVIGRREPRVIVVAARGVMTGDRGVMIIVTTDATTAVTIGATTVATTAPRR